MYIALDPRGIDFTYPAKFKRRSRILVPALIERPNLQVVLLVYMTLVGCLLIGSQYIQPLSEQNCTTIIKDWHIPPASPKPAALTSFQYEGGGFKHDCGILFHMAQFVMYLGWFTVAKIILNPFGDDVEDFDTSYMINRNLQTSLQIVDGNPEVSEEWKYRVERKSSC